ncbi:MAG TPA: hypothetical protein VG246_00515 [Acidimicrobiales bacterium]|nr:hypothetical protein [Acidimicrobiales bacterium]
MITGRFSELFVVIAESAATQIGLLFVAVTVGKRRADSGAAEIGDFRAAASLFAFTNALVVSLYGMVPGNNTGYPSLIMGILGILFVGAGVRTTLAQPIRQQRRSHQLPLIVGLTAVFGFQIVYGLRLLDHPFASGNLSIVGDVLIASLLIGIGRAWELVGSWDTGMISSIRYLFGHPPSDVGE